VEFPVRRSASDRVEATKRGEQNALAVRQARPRWWRGGRPRALRGCIGQVSELASRAAFSILDRCAPVGVVDRGGEDTFVIEAWEAERALVGLPVLYLGVVEVRRTLLDTVRDCQLAVGARRAAAGSA
jgi:hypothetical protein